MVVIVIESEVGTEEVEIEDWLYEYLNLEAERAGMSFEEYFVNKLEESLNQ